MIKINNLTYSWNDFPIAIRGMRNSWNSWDKSDSHWDYSGLMYHDDIEQVKYHDDGYIIGPDDMHLMQKLIQAGGEHSKFLRMINVSMDITAPLYWWKEFDTYKVGTVANSCSTMHTISKKEFELNDFSWENLLNTGCTLEHEILEEDMSWTTEEIEPTCLFQRYILPMLNVARAKYLETNDKIYWWQMIQLLPESYNQKRTVMTNYAVLRNIYQQRRHHKLDEWVAFCLYLENLPYGEQFIAWDGTYKSEE